MMNPRPLSMRNRIRLLIALTILVWATQTLLHQWGFGQVIEASPSAEPDSGNAFSNAAIDADEADAKKAKERFVPGTARFAAGASLEVRSEAVVVGAEVRLKQVCRWTERDDSVFAPMAELVLARLDEKNPYESISLQQIKATLHDAGANLAAIRFAGTTSCTVSRSDVTVNEQDALAKWAAAKQDPQNPAAEILAEAAKAQTATSTPTSLRSESSAAAIASKTPTTKKPVATDAAEKDDSPVRTLKSLIITDLAQRLGVAEDQLELSFNPRDEKLLKLAEPAFKFQIVPQRAKNVGSVSWNVVIAAGDKTQTVLIAAGARAWQQQVVLARPLAYRQVIQESDLQERRTLVDNILDDKLLERPQIVGQQAARDLKPGQVMTARLVEAVPLARQGQFVTITLNRGGVRIKTVARAMESGSFGQTVRVKNEATREIYEVVLTGPQEATLTPPADAVKPATGIASVKED